MATQERFELTKRRQQILRLVIQEYVKTATPVASETLVRKYGLRVSSATVRNELSFLEEIGLLTHPHTSAGRIPTDSGYRYFVEQLMEWQPLSSDDRRMIRHQFYQVRTDMEEWSRLAAAALARLSQSTAMVTPARSPQIHFKHLEMLSVYETRVLLVVILRDGTIRQHMLTLDESITQDELSQMANKLNEQMQGQSAAQIASLGSEEWSRLERQVRDLVVGTMEQLNRWECEPIIRDGLIQALSQPEFAAVERTREFLEILDQPTLLAELLGRALQQNGVQIIIGGESRHKEMRNYSMVVSRYGLEGRLEGVLGILGPTRMPYPRSVSSVHFIARLMSELLGQLPG
ncbi:MAG: heat-inducible transcription repressor HrcA [Chloroflexia bacterium]|nr:heat-inducible transcription repressor HrcA [Chloroflexia bacterium]